jgi:hypothetical protein
MKSFAETNINVAKLPTRSTDSQEYQASVFQAAFFIKNAMLSII